MPAIRLVTRFQDLDDGPGALAAAADLRVPRWNNTTSKLEMTAVAAEMRSYGPVQTTDATVTTLATVAIPTDTAVGFLVRVVSIRNDQTEALQIVDAFLVKNNAGTLVQVGTATRVHVNRSVAAWDVTHVISGTNLLVRVTGEAAKTIDWYTAIETTQQLAA